LLNREIPELTQTTILSLRYNSINVILGNGALEKDRLLSFKKMRDATDLLLCTLKEQKNRPQFLEKKSIST